MASPESGTETTYHVVGQYEQDVDNHHTAEHSR